MATPFTAKDRKIGALLGVHTGDSLGATLEFVSWERVKREYPQGLRTIIGKGRLHWPAGHATDDTDLTRAALLAYYEKHTTKDLPSSFDITTRETPQTSLLTYESSHNAKTCGSGLNQARNDSLMRYIPTALFVSDSQTRRWEESISISAITHDDPRCTISSAIYNEIAYNLIHQGDTSTPFTSIKTALSFLLDNPQYSSECPSELLKSLQTGQVISLASLRANGPDKESLPFGGKGYVLDSLTLAIAAVLDERSFEDILVDIVMLGGDSDTNGAIAGGLLGARDGVDAIPLRWREKLQFGKEFVEVMEKVD